MAFNDTTVDISIHMVKSAIVRGNGHYIGYAEYIDADTFAATVRAGGQAVTWYGTKAQLKELAKACSDAVGNAFDDEDEKSELV